MGHQSQGIAGWLHPPFSPGSDGLLPVWWQIAACHKDRAESSGVTTSSSHNRGRLPRGHVWKSLHPQLSSKSEWCLWTDWQMLEAIQLHLHETRQAGVKEKDHWLITAAPNLNKCSHTHTHTLPTPSPPTPDLCSLAAQPLRQVGSPQQVRGTGRQH